MNRGKFHQSRAASTRFPLLLQLSFSPSGLNLGMEPGVRYVSGCGIKIPSLLPPSALAAECKPGYSHESWRENRANLILRRVQSVQRASEEDA